MGKGYNDAGARSKRLTSADNAKENAETASDIGDSNIKAADEAEKDFAVIEKYIKAHPELAEAFKRRSGNVMMEEVVRGMSAKKAADIGPEGRDEGKSWKIRSMDELKRAKQIVDKLDDDEK